MDLRTRKHQGALLSGVFLSVLLAVLLGGCGASSGSDDVVPQAPATETRGGAVDTELTVVVNNGGKTDTWTLTCDAEGKSPGGTHPEAAKACAALTAKGAQAMPAVKPDMMCTQIYGGDQTATVKGTWKGDAVDASFNRKNGCEISRWKALEGLLPAPSGGAGPQ